MGLSKKKQCVYYVHCRDSLVKYVVENLERRHSKSSKFSVISIITTSEPEGNVIVFVSDLYFLMPDCSHFLEVEENSYDFDVPNYRAIQGRLISLAS